MKRLLLLLKILCVAVILFGSFRIYRIYASKAEVDSSFENLKRQVTVETTEPEASSEPEPTEPTVSPSIKQFNEKFRTLYDQNSDIVGWLTVEGTDIDYPVMQAPDDYYLTHSFEGYYSRHGTPYLASGCNVYSSDNLVINGHNMRDGTMFSQLTRFTDPLYCENASPIVFDTIWGDHSWQPACVFLITAEEAQQFPYHTITVFSENTMTRAQYLSGCSRYAVWKDDKLLAAEGQLLTLSTCEYSQKDGRLVVIAVEVPADRSDDQSNP